MTNPMNTKTAIANLMNVANAVLSDDQKILVIHKQPMDNLLKAVKDLIQDIDDMRCIPDDSHEDSSFWFGPFSEFDNQIETVNVEWPNVCIDLESLKKALIKFEGDNL